LPLQTDHSFILAHTYAREGNFDVSVIVEDDLGETALATLKVSAGNSPGMPVHIAAPVFPPTPANAISPGKPLPFLIQLPMTQPELDHFTAGYLLDANDDISVSYRINPPDVQWVDELPLEFPAASARGNQSTVDSDAIFLEKLQKATGTLTSGSLPAKKVTNFDTELQPDNNVPQKLKPDRPSFQQRGTKKNFQVLFRLRPVLISQKVLASRLMAKRGPGNVLLAVLVLRWGNKNPNHRARKSWGRNRLRRWNRYQMHTAIPEGRSVGARGPPGA
ncbi:MAG TPA: hypothetical protein VKE98_24675, partial [Gemmataceae bacterium]|nr:hypothetical protein [Gemmataceae bacterium]